MGSSEHLETVDMLESLLRRISTFVIHGLCMVSTEPPQKRRTSVVSSSQTPILRSHQSPETRTSPVTHKTTRRTSCGPALARSRPSSAGRPRVARASRGSIVHSSVSGISSVGTSCRRAKRKQRPLQVERKRRISKKKRNRTGRPKVVFLEDSEST